jgi:hypothetical protein
LDSHQVESIGEYPQDVSRGIGEHVSRVSVVLGARWKPSCDWIDVTVAIGVNQTTDQGLGMSGDDLLLPWFEPDLPFVLPPRGPC